MWAVEPMRSGVDTFVAPSRLVQIEIRLEVRRSVIVEFLHTVGGDVIHPAKRNLFALNVVGGLAVLGSYGIGLATHPDSAGAVWGGVPESLRPVYTANMLLAAAGYFAFSFFVFFRVDPDAPGVAGGRVGFGVFPLVYALILIPSALWMPLTFAMLDAPSGVLWLAIRLVLFAVGLGSLGLWAAIAATEAPGARVSKLVALMGCTFFVLQTMLLDAIVWPAYFPTT